MAKPRYYHVLVELAEGVHVAHFLPQNVATVTPPSYSFKSHLFASGLQLPLDH